MPKKRSEAQAFRFEAWKNAHLHLTEKAVTLNDLRLQVRRVEVQAHHEKLVNVTCARALGATCGARQ